MAERIIVNTGPLIAFAKIGCLGRRAALASGLRVIGALGLLGRAKILGLIPELKPLIEKAVAEGIRYHRELVRAVLDAAGE